jgi:hypothetical protein
MKNKLPYIIPLGIFVIGAIFILFGQPNVVPSKITSQPRRAPTPTYIPFNIPQTTLFVRPMADEKYADGTIPMELYISSKENKITNVYVEISYDPKVLKFESIRTDELAGGKTVYQKDVDEVNGKIKYGIKNTPGANQPPIQGTDEIGDLLFKPLAKSGTTTQIAVLPSSKASAEGTTESVVINTKATKITLK